MSLIASIQACLQESAAVTFTPDSSGQAIKAVASLPNPADDIDPSNNQVIVHWSGGGAPTVLEIAAEHDGDDQADVAGRYIAGVELNNAFYATVQEGDQPIDWVSLISFCWLLVLNRSNAVCNKTCIPCVRKFT